MERRRSDRLSATLRGLFAKPAPDRRPAAGRPVRDRQLERDGHDNQLRARTARLLPEPDRQLAAADNAEAQAQHQPAGGRELHTGAGGGAVRRHRLLQGGPHVRRQ